MKFKEYLRSITENDILAQIRDIIDELSEEEIDNLGYFLYTEFLDCDEDCEEEEFSVEDVLEMIHELGEEMYEDVLDFLQFEEFEWDEADPEGDELDEAVSRIMRTKNINRKKRKFMSKSKAYLRKTAAQRKRYNRMNKAARKRYYRANKQKIAAYQKSRRAAIKRGKHKVKMRRTT